MGTNECQPPNALLRGLDATLPASAFDNEAPSFLLYEALSCMKEMEHLTADETILKMEFQFMTAEERRRLSRALAAARRKEQADRK